MDALFGYQVLSFMDDFLGYNQISMHPDDQEKTSFITEEGTYCYKAMPFDLKNVRATYQKLMIRIFLVQIRESIEVYMDDMIVNSISLEKHLVDL